MPGKKFILSGPETVTLAGQTVDKLIHAGDGDAALLYLYMLKTHGQSTPDEAASEMGKSAGWIASAMAVLSRLCLIKHDSATGGDADATGGDADATTGGDTDAGASQPPTAALLPEEPRRYTPEEIKREIDSGSNFSALVDEVQRNLGKILSPDELERFFGIYDALRLPAEVIMLLITHCISESRIRGDGRMPSMRYIEKAAFTWEREGIFSLDRAEEYLKALESRKSARGEIKAALQISGRELSDTEKRYVDDWIAKGFGPEAVAIAYDRTIIKTGKPAFGYMNSIINNWYGKGLIAPKDIMEKDGKTDRYPPRDSTGDSKQKFGDANHEEIERMQRLLKKIKEE